jgi:hypothetical protein
MEKQHMPVLKYLVWLVGGLINRKTVAITGGQDVHDFEERTYIRSSE